MDKFNPTDEALMARFRDGFDEAAFRQVVARYHAGASALARCLLRNDAAADDAVQEAFVRVVRNRRRYDPALPFKPWFFRILRNVCRDAQRKWRRHRDKIESYGEVRATRVVSARADSWRDLLEVVSPEDRQVLVLRFVEGMSFAEIAAALDCSQEAAKKRGQRALARLREAKRAADTQDEVLYHGCAGASAGRADHVVPARPKRPVVAPLRQPRPDFV